MTLALTSKLNLLLWNTSDLKILVLQGGIWRRDRDHQDHVCADAVAAGADAHRAAHEAHHRRAARRRLQHGARGRPPPRRPLHLPPLPDPRARCARVIRTAKGAWLQDFRLAH